MPYAFDPIDDLSTAVQQITLSGSDSDYIDQLIPVIKDVRGSGSSGQLMAALNQLSAEREAEIEKICNSNHQEFVGSVNQLLRVREGTVNLTSEILDLNQSIQASTEKLASQKKALVDSRSVRQNIDETTAALNACLEVLRLANQVHDLLGKKRHYAALRALDELRNVHLREVSRYKIAELIERSVPATQKLIADAVMTDLKTWLYRIREASQYLGEVAFYHTEKRRGRMRERIERDETLAKFKLNSAIELAADEMEEFDILNDEETETQVDFSPLFECIHIHETLGQMEEFKTEYAANRKKQKDLLIPTSVTLEDEEEADLRSLLESIAGFAIVERATMAKTNNFRAPVDVDELWESMSSSAIRVIENALPKVDDDEKLLKIKTLLALFIQTMDNWGYSVVSWNAMVLSIFEQYATLLKKRFGDDFQEVVGTDDYMPMQIQNQEEYDKVIEVSWYSPDSDEPLRFPCVLPFSQMYPFCCIDMRNFLNQIYQFSDENFTFSAIIDKTLMEALDDLICDKICRLLEGKLGTQYPGQIVQILTNLEYFEHACTELETLLYDARSSSVASGPVQLNAVEKFRGLKKTAEKRIFELVNSKIDDLIETAEYNWTAIRPESEVSLYMQELTQYLSASMSSVLLGLPPEIKELVYFDSLSHTTRSVLQLALDDNVQMITPAAANLFAMDVKYLSDWVDTLPNPILRENIDELVQSVALMQTEDQMEFFDISVANKKYGRVDRNHGAILLDKVEKGKIAAEKNAAGAAGVSSPKENTTTREAFNQYAQKYGFSFNRGSS